MGLRAHMETDVAQDLATAGLPCGIGQRMVGRVCVAVLLLLLLLLADSSSIPHGGLFVAGKRASKGRSGAAPSKGSASGRHQHGKTKRDSDTKPEKKTSSLGGGKPSKESESNPLTTGGVLFAWSIILAMSILGLGIVAGLPVFLLALVLAFSRKALDILGLVVSTIFGRKHAVSEQRKRQ